MDLEGENMKWKMIFHPKFLSILVILLLSGIAIAPSFNAIKVTETIDNISNINIEEKSELVSNTEPVEVENNEILIDDCNCHNNSENTGYPERICDFLFVLYNSYTIIMVLPFILAFAYYEYGYISETMLKIIWGAIFLPMYPVVKLNELLNCPDIEFDFWWNDPWLNN